MTVRGCYQFRVTRNSELFVDEEEVKNLRRRCRANYRIATLAMRFDWKWRTTARRG
jgi:polyphosphate kinase